jgi:AcrR family transcriptional regulator
LPTSNPPKSQTIERPRRGLSRQLDRAKIVAAARELTRTEGAGGLSMRGIARHLGVDPAALYWHFADKAELIDAVARDAADERALVVDTEGTWQTRARSLCHELADRLRGEPALQGLGGQNASLGPFIARATGATGRVLADAGLHGEELIFAAHTLVHAVTAVLAAESSRAETDPEAIRRYMRGVAEELPGPESERWIDVARRDPQHSFDAYLDHAVEIVIAGIEARAAAAARRR